MRRVVAVSFCACVTLLGCRPLFRAPALEPKKDVDDAAVARTMSLDLVSDLGRKTIAFEVHWVDGYRPTPFAMDGLREAIRRFAPEKTVTIEVDETPIPKAEWEGSDGGEGEADAWVERHLRALPGSDPGPIQVHYIPNGRKWFDMGFFGMASGADVERPDGSFARVPVIYMASQTIVDNSILWLAPKRGERSTLIHEFGHMLGLSRVESHAQREDPSHCTEPQCVMAPPRVRNILYNAPRGFFTGTIPTWYCRKCTGDLATARAWAAEQSRNGVDPIATTRESDRIDAARYEIAVRVRRGREADAKARLDALLQAVPWHEGYYNLAHAVSGLAWFSESERVFLQYEAGAKKPEADVGRQYRLEVVACQGRYDEVLAELDRSDIPRLRVDALQGLGRPDDAVAAARVYLEALPAELAVWGRLRLADTLRDAGRFDEAFQALDGAGGGSPQSFRVRLARVETLVATGRREEAAVELQGMVKALDRLSKGERSWYDAVLPVARAHALLGDRQTALTTLCGSASCRMQGWRRVELARILALTGGHAEAMESLVDARKEGGVPRLNPCLDRDLRVLRSDPRFDGIFPCAPKTAK